MKLILIKAKLLKCVELNHNECSLKFGKHKFGFLFIGNRNLHVQRDKRKKGSLRRDEKALTCCLSSALRSPLGGASAFSSVSFLITHSVSSLRERSKADQCSALLSRRFLWTRKGLVGDFTHVNCGTHHSDSIKVRPNLFYSIPSIPDDLCSVTSYDFLVE